MPPANQEEQQRSAELRKRVNTILYAPLGPSRRGLAEEAAQIVKVLGTVEVWGGGSAASDPVDLADMGLKTLLEGRSMLTKNLDRWEAILDERDRLAHPPLHAPPLEPEPEPAGLDARKVEMTLAVRENDEDGDSESLVPAPFLAEFMQSAIDRAEDRAARAEELADELRGSLDASKELLDSLRSLAAGPRTAYVESLLARLSLVQGDEHAEIADRIERALGIAG